jgi:hypothetical protein
VRSLALRRSRAHRPVLRLQQSSAQAHRYALQRKQRTCKPWDACKPATPGRRRIASSTWREDPLRQLQQPRDSAGERGTKAGLELFDMCMMKFDTTWALPRHAREQRRQITSDMGLFTRTRTAPELVLKCCNSYEELARSPNQSVRAASGAPALCGAETCAGNRPHREVRG